MRRFTTRQMVYMALLITLNIILTRMASIHIVFGGVEGVRVGFGGLPVILAGVMLGPIAGGLVGALGDILGYFVNPIGAFMPHFALTAALRGIIPGLLLFNSKRVASFWYTLLAVAVGQIISSLILVPYFLKLLFGIPIIATLPGRLISQGLTIPFYAAVTVMLMKRIYAEEQSLFYNNQYSLIQKCSEK